MIPPAMSAPARQYVVVDAQLLINALVSVDNVLTVTEAAKLLKLQRGSVSKMVQRGTLKSIRIGAHLYVLRSEVIERATRSR